jgi:ribosomal protein S14|tara:strand:+ start:139 stop:321 length:183 start_codon:yes stop_codon:yes gene_type:complete
MVKMDCMLFLWGMELKKDDVIIITCNVCGAMSHAVKTKIPQGYYIKDEFVLCRICFGDLN